jgi:hypothetical protein
MLKLLLAKKRNSFTKISKNVSFPKVTKMNTFFQECEQHLALGSEAETHYKAVCRALVTITITVNKLGCFKI